MASYFLLVILFAPVAAQDPSKGVTGVEWKVKGGWSGKPDQCQWQAIVSFHVTDFRTASNELSYWRMNYVEGDDGSKCCTEGLQFGTNSDSSSINGTMSSDTYDCKFNSTSTYTWCACGEIIATKEYPQLGSSMSSTSPEFTQGSTTIKSCALTVVAEKGYDAETKVTLDLQVEAVDGSTPAPALSSAEGKALVLSSSSVSGTTCDILELESHHYTELFMPKNAKESFKTELEGKMKYKNLGDTKEEDAMSQPDACKAVWAKAETATVKIRSGVMAVFPEDFATLVETECTLSWTYNAGSSPSPPSGGSPSPSTGSSPSPPEGDSASHAQRSEQVGMAMLVAAVAASLSLF
eukprot:gnl/MRDRNA2_/MRDRNA2_86185_c0_seq1.p1 gnl/MRDRNA2_/MRDRNA2_86185_c0~~gnl/MRDRNA2_/MRDRNA2_86185_c0_seq1.p1  ORF type:complete len:384 (+),score=68.57 gnl/MRDRNA2_/MRDRNA2_86185_c0_seq1:102-1154(+)